MTDQRKKRVGSLDTIGRTRSELARVYREARKGEIAIEDLRAFVYALRELRETIQRGDLEQRLDDLERAQQNGVAK